MKKIRLKIAKTFAKKIKKLATERTTIVLFVLHTCVFGAILAYALWPKNITYNYAQAQTCYTSPSFLPNQMQKKGSEDFELISKNNIKIKNLTLFSKTSCLQIKNFTKGTQVIKSHLPGNKLIAKTVKVNSSIAPQILPIIQKDTPISAIGNLELSLNQADRTFNYTLKANNLEVACQNNTAKIICPLKDLKLAQAQMYTFNLEQKLNEQLISTLYQIDLKTVDPITITGQSILPSSTVYDVPSQITLTSNKELTNTGTIRLINTTDNSSVNIKANNQGNQLIINFESTLARETKFQLTVNGLSAPDQATLDTEFAMEFTTSGGPKVIGTNTGTYGQSVNKNFVLNFDSSLLPGQNFASITGLAGPNGVVPANINASEKSITITPSAQLARCTNYSINLESGLKNTYGVPNEQGYKLNFRTICQEVFSIGSSVLGRSITAYKFGNGPTKTIFVGATHGDEAGSKYLLDSWVNELEANYHKISADRTIYVIPNLNPDGFAVRSRTNANNVDLNRNFPANNWKADVTMPGGSLVVNGGGTSALSETESQAIANFILSQSPELVLTYHSKGSMVIANESGNSVSLAQSYANKSPYYATKESALGATFAYDTTGAMENWLHDKHGIATLLIELSTHNANEFGSNKSAMWAMIN